MADKRCYNKSEAIEYFGINRSAFEVHIEPELEGKGIRVGSCLVYEARDLDLAWEAFKKKAKAKASALPRQRAETSETPLKKIKQRSREPMPSAESSSALWNAAVKSVLEKDKTKKR